MKNKINSIAITIFILLSANISNAQITFQKTFGGAQDETAISVHQTTDGGYIMTGGTRSFGIGQYDNYIIRANPNGDKIWANYYGTSATGNDYGSSVVQTADGGFVIGGTTTKANGFIEVYMIKLDTLGNDDWFRTFGTAYSASAYSIKQTADGGYILSGEVSAGGAGSYDLYLAKTDSNGDTLWQKTYGGFNYDSGNSVALTNDGGYFLTGYALSFGAGDYDVYVVKTDSVGNLQWSKTYGGPGYDKGAYGIQTSDGGYIITGITPDTGTSSDVYLIKTDVNGDTLWTKTYGGTDYEIGACVQQTTDGGYIITGRTRSFGSSLDLYLIKVDSIGNVLWSKTMGGSSDGDVGNFVEQTADGGYVLSGYTWNFGAVNTDCYLIKTDANGNSGCNETNVVTTVNTPATQVSNCATIVTTPAFVIGNPTSTSSGTTTIVHSVCSNVGINEIVNDNPILILPNPSQGEFTITYPENFNKGTIEIYTPLGEKIYSMEVNHISKEEIRLKNTTAGIYFLKMFDGEKNYCQKIIVGHD